MAVTHRELLTQMLEDLLEAEFKRFKWKLHEIQAGETKKHIPRGLLEKADPLCTADLLVDYFGEGAAAKTTVRVLNLINKRELATQLEAKLKVITRPEVSHMCQDRTDCQVLYKAAIRQRFSKVKDYNSLPGEWVDLEKRYIQLLIIKKHRNSTEREQALLSRGRNHLEMLDKFQEDGAARARIDTFLAMDKKGQAPLTLIVEGAAGIGKSYTLRKMMLDWASDRLYPERFDYVLHLNIKELSFEKQNVSLEDLIVANFKGLRPSIDQILLRPENLFFLIDGFDELKSLPDEAEEATVVSTKTPYPAPIVVSLLLRRQLLPECSLLITTRPTALEKLESYVCADCYFEILGFLEEERRSFFYNFFQDDCLAQEAYTAIRENETISTMCFVPMVCWIVCTVLKKQMETGRGLANIQTTTQIFLHFTQILLQHHHSRPPSGMENWPPKEDLLERLGSLALQGILRQQVIFESEDLKAHYLEASEIPTAFLNAFLRQSVTIETVYSFGHVTLQEFFAALFYFLACQKVHWEHDVHQLLEEGLKAENGHLLLAIRFLFGLSNSHSCKMLSQLMRGSSSVLSLQSNNANDYLLSWMQRAARTQQISDPHFHLELLHCLYEAHQEELVKQAMVELDNIRFVVFHLKRSDCLTLAYCAQCCDTIQNLHLFCCGLGEEEMKQLKPVLKKCQTLQLEANNLSDAVLRGISSSLSERQTMTKIHLTSILTSEQTVFKCSAVEGPAEFSLEIRYIRGDEAATFCSWVIPQHHPSQVILWKTELSDHGLQKICTALHCAKNHLQTLRVSGNNLSCACVPDLTSLVAKNPLLTVLDLSSNSLGNEAVILLCSELQASGTRLQNLSLEENLLSVWCVPAISSLVTMVPTLTTLKVGFNNLGETGVQLLWPVLGNPLCKLVELGLDANNLTDACIESLAEWLLPNQTLKILRLSCNSLTPECLPHLDCVWRECNSLCFISISLNRIPKAENVRYTTYYNAKSKRSWEDKEKSQ